MFGHLKAEDFTNLMEGMTLSNKQRAHLESCARCAETLKATEEIRNHVSEMRFAEDEHIPEPDWSEFRGDVRNALLSRSVQRTNKQSSWLAGLGWKPAAALGFSLLLVIGITTSTMFRQRSDRNEQTISEVAPVNIPSAISTSEINTLADMSKPDPIESLLKLNQDETATLVMILDEMTPNPEKAKTQ